MTLGVLEFGSWEEATLKAGKSPTTTRARVARDFKPRREDARDDLFLAMGCASRNENSARTIDLKEAHLNAKCDVEEWVELPDEFKKFGKYAKLTRWSYGMTTSAFGWQDDFARRLGDWRVSTWQCRFNEILPKTLCTAATSRSQPLNRS